MQGNIIKLEDKLFKVEFEDAAAAKAFKDCTKLEYAGRIYEVKNVHMCAELGLFFLFVVTTE